MSLIFRSGHDHYLNALRQELADIKNVLELGCGTQSPLTQIRGDFALDGADISESVLKSARETGKYRQLFKQDITHLNFGDNSYDTVCALDLIEHLPREKGELLLTEMERIARLKVILFTPNGFLKQSAYDNNPWQLHLSGWNLTDFQHRGYRVYGMNGIKFLRTERARMRWKPAFFWRQFSNLSQYLVKPIPKLAFQLLAVKDISQAVN